MELQETIERLLRATKREHVEELLTFMHENGYYSANCPPSHNYSGGLAHYSMEVLLRMQRKNDIELPIDSVIIVALTHGMCYIPGFDSVRGDGARSALLISREAGFELNLMEYQAIQWHKQGREKKGKLGSYFDAVLNNQLWDLLRKAIAYCVKHPLNEEDLEYAMSAKPRRRTRITEDVFERGLPHGLCGDSNNIRFSITREISEEEIHYREVRRNRVGLDDIFAATDNIFWTYQTTVLTDDYHKEQDNSGFRDNYIKEHPKDVEYHRTELGELCKKKHTKEVVKYIYFNDKARDAFRAKNMSNMHKWLTSEFGYKVSYSAFEKAYKAFKKVDNQMKGIV